MIRLRHWPQYGSSSRRYSVGALSSRLSSRLLTYFCSARLGMPFTLLVVCVHFRIKCPQYPPISLSLSLFSPILSGWRENQGSLRSAARTHREIRILSRCTHFLCCLRVVGVGEEESNAQTDTRKHAHIYKELRSNYIVACCYCVFLVLCAAFEQHGRMSYAST